MNTPIEDRDLTKEAPHSPGDRFGGFAILARTTDKCRASLAGTAGEYHFDCPLDNLLFGFKGIKGDQFKKTVASAKSYEDVAAWVQASGTKKSADEIEDWSDKVEETMLKDVPSLKDKDRQKEVKESCEKLGLDFDSATLFEWLDADDEASYQELAHK